MRVLTFLAAAALAAGIYHYRRQLGRRRDRLARANELLAERPSEEPLGDLGPMQSGMATEA